MASNTTSMTERQLKAWPQAVAEIQRYVDTSTVPTSPNHHDWKIIFAEESRPGRGHQLDATWCDGEYLAQIRMDVYGYPSVSVAEVSWLHNSSYEECECTYCERERDEDD